MAMTLDFNSLAVSFMDITLRDEARTTVHLDLPVEALADELGGLAPHMEAMRKGDRTGVGHCYDLAARLINHNFDGITVTGEELRDHYGMHLLLILRFLSSYMDALKALEFEKN